MNGVPNLAINVLNHPDRVADFWAWLTKPGRRYVACDTETTGLDWYSPRFRVRMIQFGDCEGGWAIPFQGWKDLVKGVLQWCSQQRVKLIFHNVAYDEMALRSQGVRLDWTVVQDTFVWASILGYAEQPRTLKGSGQREFGAWVGVGERVLKDGMKNAGWTWADVPFGWKPYPLYGVVDVCATSGLWERWEKGRERWQADHSLEIAVIRICNEMAWNGVSTDGAYLHGQIDNHHAELDELRTTLAPYGIDNPDQGGQVAMALEKAGVVLTEKTATGQTKLDKEILDQIDHPIAAQVRRFRWVSGTLSKYLVPLFDLGGGSLDRGIVHPGIKTIEARTGRMSIENPPMQQLPSNDPTVRRGIVGRTPDEDVISSDYGQVELRIWGSINDDQKLLDVIRLADATGGDFFVEIGRQVYNEPDFVKKDARRTLLKSTIYAKLFGGGMEVAAATAGVPLYSLTPTWKMLEDSYPSLKDVGHSLISTHKNDAGELEHTATSPYGRVFRVLDPIERRKLPNYVTQGTAAVALKKALLSLDAAGFGQQMMLPVHDEVLFSTPRNEVAEAKAEIAECMNGVFSNLFDIQILAEPSSGPTWADAKG